MDILPCMMSSEYTYWRCRAKTVFDAMPCQTSVYKKFGNIIHAIISSTHQELPNQLSNKYRESMLNHFWVVDKHYGVLKYVN
jgi:nitrogenase subunit NifH